MKVLGDVALDLMAGDHDWDDDNNSHPSPPSSDLLAQISRTQTHRKGSAMNFVAFDLLALNRKDLWKWSLEARQGRLQALVSWFGCPGVSAAALAEKRGCEAW
jgi:hypothetical protein